MASQLLIEGLLDTKGPRGSEDRKFWKVWRRQWARFSVVYPSGRREPYLVIKLSHNSSETSEKEIKLSRDGLRLFRCRSKSRVYRAWAITSGNKIVMYFAADSEIQAQNWMQAVRDGLWPPCFSFQILTACSYEVSLIDDDNTFTAGHLGVYGRFVLTSEDVISLMHPHWGSTLLEISLDNIIDVLFIREAEISPAGVFSIILKRIEGSNVKALQFFCNKVKDAMQWILSKLYTRRKSFSLNESEKLSENRVSFSVSEDSISSEANHYKNLDKEKANSFEINNGTKITSDPLTVTNLQPVYENLRPFQSDSKYSSLDKLINEYKSNDQQNTFEEKKLERSKNHQFHGSPLNFKTVDENKLLDVISNENTYENITNKRTSGGEECFEIFGNTTDLSKLSTEYANEKDLNNKTELKTNDMPLRQTRDESVTYAVVNKSHLKNGKGLGAKYASATNENIDVNRIIKNDNFDKSETFTSSENFKNRKTNSYLSSNAPDNILPFNVKIDQNKTEESKTAIQVIYDTEFTEPSNSIDLLYNGVDKNDSYNSKLEEYSECDSFKDEKNSIKKNHDFLNLPSNLLDTSLNSLNPRTKDRGSSSSSEDENFLSLVNEFDELKVNDQIYEDILERKGTIYEEIDESEDEFSNPSLNAPELPRRPTTLEIPESLRLHKLSRNIQNTLEVMDDKQYHKEFRRPKFIKKIKDVNKIMRLSPKKEHSEEPFTVESKLKIDTINETILPPNTLNI